MYIYSPRVRCPLLERVDVDEVVEQLERHGQDVLMKGIHHTTLNVYLVE